MDAWRAHPLAWIHRAEARGIAEELRACGHDVELEVFSGEMPRVRGILLLRLSDPQMLRATRRLADARAPYCGPGAATLARCYDKWQACQVAQAHGIDIPETRLASDAGALAAPLVLKPRQGSDSIGLRQLAHGRIPARLRRADLLAQRKVIGAELTVAIIDGIAGMPLRSLLPEGVPYTFLRKYLLRPGRIVLQEAPLAEQARALALRAAAALGVDWAARVDFVCERGTGRLVLLECDAAPLVGARSSFSASLAAAGMARASQLARLLGLG
jgi:D-alanine-D-alanine ligase-like ATP-grasp enzyme